MRNLKKFLALVLAMIMVVGASAVVSADFTDVAADNQYAEAIADLTAKGIIKGENETTFAPEKDVTRWHMALFMARATTGEVEEDWANGGIVPFTDVTEYKGAISYAYVNGIIKGRTETVFAPNDNITYAEALTMAVRALGYTEEKLDYPWGFHNKAVALGLTEGVAVDAINTTLDRAETAQIIYNMIYAERANADVSFATEFFGHKDVNISALYVITATPKQALAQGYDSSDRKEEGTFVGVQPLVNGVPAGEVIYLPVEDLGIEAADVEDYINYTVELVNFDAKTGKFQEAILGEAPVKVYTDDVTFERDKNGNLVANTTKITIDGTKYNLVDTVSGTVLKNELVAFSAGDVNIYQAKYLLEINGIVYSNAASTTGRDIVATLIGTIGNTKYYAAHQDSLVLTEDLLCEHGVEIGEACVTVPAVVDDPATPEDETAEEIPGCDGDNPATTAEETTCAVADGVKDSTISFKAGQVIDEAQALEAWGFSTDAVEYTKYSTLTVPEIDALNAYELSLFDDNKDGKYDRACVTRVYVSAYSTFKSKVDVDENGKKDDTCDSIATVFADKDILAADVTYSDETVKTAGTVFTFTYNPETKTVYVIDKLTMQTAKLNKVDATDKANGNYVVTLGTDVYTAKLNSANGNVGAVAVEYENKTFKNMSTIADGNAYKAMPNDNVIALNAAANIGAEYNFYAIGDCILWIEPVEEVSIYADFIVLDSVARFDVGKLYLNAYVDGVKKEVEIVEFEGVNLAELSDLNFSRWLTAADNANKFDGSTIYAIKNTVDGVKVVGTVDFADGTYDDYVHDKDDKGKGYTLNHVGYGNRVIVDSKKVMTFEDGVTRYRVNGDDADEVVPVAQRLRTHDNTVFYFIDRVYDDNGHTNDAKTEIKVYVGSPEEATIKLGLNTHIYIDWLNYSENTDDSYRAPSASLVIVVDAEAHDGFGFSTRTETVGLFMPGEDATEVAANAKTDFELADYGEEIDFHKYTGSVIDLETGEYVTVYSPVALKGGYVYEFDANGVILDYADLVKEDWTEAKYGKYEYELDEAVAAKLLVDLSGKKMTVDYDLNGTKRYHVTSGGEIICDRDGVKVGSELKGIVKKLVTVNVGDDWTFAGGSGNITNKEGEINTSWDNARNLLNNKTPVDCYILANSINDGTLVIVYAFN